MWFHIALLATGIVRRARVVIPSGWDVAGSVGANIGKSPVYVNYFSPHDVVLIRHGRDGKTYVICYEPNIPTSTPILTVQISDDPI